MQRAILRTAATSCVLISWIGILSWVAPDVMKLWQGMNLASRWDLGIIVCAVLLTGSTVRRLSRVADRGTPVLDAQLTPFVARAAGMLDGVNDRAQYPGDAWRQICRHEAAHAVALLAQGGTLWSIELKRVGSSAASVTGEFGGDLLVQDFAWKHLVWGLASHVIDEADDVHSEGSTHDITNALQNVATILSTGRRPTGYEGELSMDQLIAGARAHAKALLDTHHDTLEALQTELLSSDRVLWLSSHLPCLAAMKQGDHVTVSTMVAT